jgi:L-ascorbate metabolism protein UlaG (beta-lactamase superfamily)
MKSIHIASLVGLALVLVVFGALATSSAAPLTPADVIRERPSAAPTAYLRASGGGSPIHFTVTRIAHASVLLDFGNATVLTDPWFTEKTHYHHGEPLGIGLDQLPRLTAIVASHAHYDHFDIEGFASYPYKDVPFFVGPDMAESARKAGFTNVRELHPWESARVGLLTITGAPAGHGVPEISYVIQANDATVYFGGDTLLIRELREMAVRFPSIQLALLAANGLRVLGKQVVMNPEEAADLTALIKAEVVVPTHYQFKGSWFTDTFILSYDGTPERFVAAMHAKAPETDVRVLLPGQNLRIERRTQP